MDLPLPRQSVAPVPLAVALAAVRAPTYVQRGIAAQEAPHFLGQLPIPGLQEHSAARAEDLCVSQFGPNLLGQGDIKGPRTQVETHRQTINLEEAKAGFQQEAKKRSRCWRPEVLLSCCLCRIEHVGQASLKPLTAFLASEDAAHFSVVVRGMDRVCRVSRAARPTKLSAGTLCARGARQC